MDAARNLAIAENPGTTQFGRYRLLESIGQGGMANVMVAVMPGPARFNKLLVLKTICEHIRSDNDQYAKMFLDEARLAARLSHQNVVHTYEVGDEKGVYYIAMEYLEGQALSQVQRKLGLNALPLEARLRILIDTAHGLHHAHELTDYSGRSLHVVHRDVSPQNIFLTYDGQVKLLDFGIATMRDAETVTVVGQIKGKIDYMAPEQLKGEPVDRRADVFALGAIMWELLAGKPMSGGRDVSQVTRVHNRLAKREASLASVMPDLDLELTNICDKAVSHERSDRYVSALEFARDLQQYLAQRSLIPTAQQLAQILQPTFQEERSERRKRIDAALADVEREQTELTASGVHDSGARLALSQKLQVESDRPDLKRSSATTQAETRISELAPVPEPKRSSSLQKVAIVLLVVGMAAWLPLRSEPEKAQPVPQPVRTESAVQSAAPSSRVSPERETSVETPAPANHTIKLNVSSSTPSVQVLLDGSLIPHLPFEAEVAKDNAIHKLVASAPGYQTMTQVLTLDRDRQVTLALLPVEESTSSRGRKGRQHTEAVTRAPVTSSSTTSTSETEEVLPGQEMESSKLRGVEEINEEDPYR